MDLKINLLNSLKESELIEKFDYWNRKEDDLRNEPIEQSFKYRVDAQNIWRIHSIELYKRNSKYKYGSLYKFRIYHDDKMPKKIRTSIENLNGKISNSKIYIDFGVNTYADLLKVTKSINTILESN